MNVKKLIYVIRKKSTKEYLDNYGYLCDEIEDTYPWGSFENAQVYINNILDEPSEFEVARVLIDYDIED